MRLRNRTQVWSVKLCLISIVLLCFSIGLAFFGCEESPFKPVDENLTDYPIYYSHWLDEGWVFWYYPLADKFDSAAIPWDTTGEWFFTAKSPTVSHDGKLLYQPLSPKVSVFDTETWELVAELPYHVWSQQIVASPGGQYIALPGDSLRILRTTDYSLVYTFPHRTYGGHFGLSEDRYYYAFDGVVDVIELSDPYGAPRVVSTNEGYLWRVLTTPDESKWVMYGTLNMYYNIFLVYDAEKDSVIFSYPHTPGHGAISISRDGKWAFLTNPGDLTTIAGDHQITVFDMEMNRIDRAIPTIQTVDTIGNSYLDIRSMLVTPDNRWLIGLDEFMRPSFLRYDLQEKRTVAWRLIRKGIEKMSVQSMR